MTKPIPHEVIVVDHIPECQFCQDGTPGPYDFPTRMGPWANGCQMHWRQYRANRSEELGVGKGQLWILQEDVTE